MAQFSLIKTLEALYIESFPIRKFRGIVNLLRNIVTIMEELHKAKVCCLDEFFFRKMTINVEKFNVKFKNRFISSVDAYNLLIDNGVQERFNFLLENLLLYLIIRLNRCTSEDAASILHDFMELENCFFDFRKYSTWDNSHLDDNILKFLEKVIRMMNEFDLNTRKLKIFSIMRIIVTEIGKHPAYSATTVEILFHELSKFYDNFKLYQKTDDFVFENHLTHLFIINDIIGQNFVNSNKENGKIVLLKLKKLLQDSKTLKELGSLENYLVHSILSIIEVYQLN